MSERIDKRYRNVGIRRYLNAEFEKRSGKNPSYSLRAFARSLEIDHSTLSQILRGRRSATNEQIRSIAKSLRINDDTLGLILHFEKHNQISPTEASFDTLDHEVFAFVSSWEFDALLELTHLKEFNSDQNWIASRLNLDSKTVGQLIDRLVELRLLDCSSLPWRDLSENNSILPHSLGSTSDVLRKYQKDLLEKSIVALREIPIEERDHTSVITAIRASQLNEIKDEIRKFRRKLTKLMEQGRNENADSVYVFQLSLFPASLKGTQE